MAIVRDGRLGEGASCGFRHTRSPLSVDEDTVFDAASLSKPAFAHVVLQLVDQGQLTLDALLVDRLADYIVDDPRASSIAIAHALSHCAGLPNWCTLDHPESRGRHHRSCLGGWAGGWSLLWHVLSLGDNGPFTAYTIGSFQTNGASGLSIMPEIVAHFFRGGTPLSDLA